MRIRCVNIGRLLQIAVMGINILAFSFLYGFIIRIYADDGVTDFFDVKPGQVNVYEKQWVSKNKIFQRETHHNSELVLLKKLRVLFTHAHYSYLYFMNGKLERLYLTINLYKFKIYKSHLFIGVIQIETFS